MTVRKLKEKLATIGTEHDDLEVALYLPMAEDAEEAGFLEIRNVDDLPYVKGDWPEFDGSKILLIS